MTVENAAELGRHVDHETRISGWPGSVTVDCLDCQEILIELWRAGRESVGSPAREPAGHFTEKGSRHFMSDVTKIPVTLPLGPICAYCMDPVDEDLPHAKCDVILAGDEHADAVHSYEEAAQAFGRAIRASGWRIG